MLVAKGAPRKLIEFIPLIRQTRLTEKFAVAYIDDINLFCVSEADKNRLSEYLKDRNKKDLVNIIENGFPASSNEISFNKEHKIRQKRWKQQNQKYNALFIGSKNSTHNYQTVLEIRRIARIMRNRTNKLKFHIVGSNWEQYKEPNFEIIGFLEDLSEILAKTDLAFLPMVSGGGTKLKTLRFVSSKIPLVCTKYAVQGLGFKDGVHFLPISVDHPAADLMEILNKPNLNQDLERVAQNAYSAIRHLSWENIARKLANILERIVQND